MLYRETQKCTHTLCTGDTTILSALFLLPFCSGILGEAAGSSPQEAQVNASCSVRKEEVTPQEAQVKASCTVTKEEVSSTSLTGVGDQTGSSEAESGKKPSAVASVSAKSAGIVHSNAGSSSAVATTTVTVLTPDDFGSQDVCVCSESGDISPKVDVDTAAEKMEQMRVSPARVESQGTVFLPALFVFGGMDTSGTVHEDCFVIVPPC